MINRRNVILETIMENEHMQEEDISNPTADNTISDELAQLHSVRKKIAPILQIK